MEKLKVIILSDYAFVKGGAEQVAIATACGLAEKNHEVIFFSAVGPVAKELEHSGIKEIICLGQKDILDNSNKLGAMINGIYNYTAIKELKKLLSKWKPDIIHMHGLSKALSWAPVLAAKSFKIPVVYTIHDYGLFCPNLGIYNYKLQKICQYYNKGNALKCMVSNCDKRSYGQKLWRWLRYKITKNIIRFDKNVDAFIVVSSFLKKFVGENLMTDKPVRQIYNPLFIDKSVNSTIREENLIETIKKNNLLKFLYVGRLSPEKGLELLLDSIIQIKAELIIVGDGELMDKCLTASKKAEGRIKVLGYQDRQFVFKIMKACDCLVLPSKCIEPAPLVLAEAGYNKLPCIVTGHGGLAEFIQPGVNGFYFEPDNLSSLKKVMEEIVKNPGILEPMKEKSREIIDNMKLHTNDYIEQITKFYFEILQ